MKKIVTIGAILLLHINSLAQISIHVFFPMDVSGILLGDTLLNKRAIMKREGITKVMSYKDSIGSINTLGKETKLLNKNGAVEKAITCIKAKRRNYPEICSNYTLLYDNHGRIIQQRMTDGAGGTFLQNNIEYIDEGKTKEMIIMLMSQSKTFDTTFTYRYYNEKDQMVRVYSEGKNAIPGNAFIFYNDDGFPDSIRYDSHQTEIFKRKQKHGNKEIQFDGMNSILKWVYTSNGQCISFEWKYKKPSKIPNTTVNYYYNPDATLSKVIEKKGGKIYCITNYSYEKTRR
jgi:hypothetical protein